MGVVVGRVWVKAIRPVTDLIVLVGSGVKLLSSWRLTRLARWRGWCLTRMGVIARGWHHVDVMTIDAVPTTVPGAGTAAVGVLITAGIPYHVVVKLRPPVLAKAPLRSHPSVRSLRMYCSGMNFRLDAVMCAQTIGWPPKQTKQNQ